MCCGRKPSRPTRGKSGKITRSKNLQALANDNIKHTERLQPPSNGQPPNQTGIVEPTEIQGQELLP